MVKVLGHAEAERLLLALPVCQADQALGVEVRRTGQASWQVAGGPEQALLPALDTLMRLAGYVATPAPDARACG